MNFRKKFITSSERAQGGIFSFFPSALPMGFSREYR